MIRAALLTIVLSLTLQSLLSEALQTITPPMRKMVATDTVVAGIELGQNLVHFYRPDSSHNFNRIATFSPEGELAQIADIVAADGLIYVQVRTRSESQDICSVEVYDDGRMIRSVKLEREMSCSSLAISRYGEFYVTGVLYEEMDTYEQQQQGAISVVHRFAGDGTFIGSSMPQYLRKQDAESLERLRSILASQVGLIDESVLLIFEGNLYQVAPHYLQLHTQGSPVGFTSSSGGLILRETADVADRDSEKMISIVTSPKARQKITNQPLMEPIGQGIRFANFFSREGIMVGKIEASY